MVIALLTDFGDYYPGVMKGLIRKMTKAEIIDITHSVSPQNVIEGAFLLYSAYRYFPKNTVFVAVVDPGVGGDRRAIAVRTSNYWFVSPDNGLVYPSAIDDGIKETYVIKDSIYEFSGNLSSTFHGRDIFAPASALIYNGDISERYFETTEPEIVKLELFDAKISDTEIRCKAVHIDRFGNVVTNIKKEDVERIGLAEIEFKGVRIPIVKKYEDVEIGSPLAIVGSFDTLELSIREGNFSKKYNVSYGTITLRWS